MRKSTDFNFVESSQLSILGWWQHLFVNFVLWTFSNLSVQYHEHWIHTIQIQKLIFCHIFLQHFNTIFKHKWLVKSSTHCWDPHCTICTFPMIGTSSHPNILKCPVTTTFFLTLNWNLPSLNFYQFILILPFGKTWSRSFPSFLA